jgi:UDP-N-acetyl-D-mannosaminouronate:lipid I N-acetyl-D-mannosaminouronosyltransferase
VDKQFSNINGFRVFGFRSRKELITHLRLNPSILIAINAEKIYSANNELKKISQNGLGYPDGIGAVIALKKKGFKNAIRIPGSELWLDIIAELQTKCSFYLIGSTQEVIEEVAKKLNEEYNGINLAGYRNGFLNPQELKNLELEIESIRPDVVFVAQGSPRQERLMKRLQNKHNAIYMGLGGSFDVYTGNVKRAPRLFRENGLEWFYRLISQPSRIKRQIILLPFAINLIRGKY